MRAALLGAREEDAAACIEARCGELIDPSNDAKG
jgi:hypothetical protein